MTEGGGEEGGKEGGGEDQMTHRVSFTITYSRAWEEGVFDFKSLTAGEEGMREGM